MIDLRLVKIDLDRKFNGPQWVNYLDRLSGCLRIMEDYPTAVQVDDTRRGRHIRMELQKGFDSPTELVAFQAACGSDGFRECMNLRRAIAGRTDDWNVLFLTKTTIDEKRKAASTFVVRYNRKASIELAKYLTTSLGRPSPRIEINALEISARLQKTNLRSSARGSVRPDKYRLLPPPKHLFE